jgi:hypothetical protein
MIRKLVFGSVLAAAVALSAPSAKANILWQYEDNWDLNADNVVDLADGWQSAQISFVPDNSNAPEVMAQATILAGNTWGKAWSETGISSGDPGFNYFFLDLAQVSGGADVKVLVSGLWGAEEMDLTPFIVAQTNPPNGPGDPPVIFNPGKYVFDLGAWNPSAVQSNVEIKLIAEGSAGSGFTVNRVFISDDWQADTAGLGLVAIPEASTFWLLASGLAVVAAWRNRRRFEQ